MNTNDSQADISELNGERESETNSAFKASLGLRLGCGLLLGAVWTGGPTETDVFTLALLSLGETASMVRLIIPEDGGFSPKPRIVPLEVLGVGSLLRVPPSPVHLHEEPPTSLRCG